MNEITWADVARDQLADIWVAATPVDRIVLEPVIVQLEQELARDPLIGESRAGNLRVVVRTPIVMWFGVAPGHVRILRVRRPK